LLFSLNLDPDGTTFWTGDLGTGNIFRFNINTGALVTQFNTAPFTQLAGVSIFGEITQGGGVAVPEPSSMLLFGLGVTGLALVRRRKQIA
jgi:hypothetical protein